MKRLTRNNTKRSGLLAASAIFLAALVVSPLTAYATPATLSDTFVNTFTYPQDTAIIEPFVCPDRPVGETYSGGFSVNYTISSGIYDGPYAGGLYTETGAVTVGTDHVGQNDDYYVTGQTASFKIDTGGGPVIKGTKALREVSGSSTGGCTAGSVRVSVGNTYTAAITDSGTKFVDRGLSSTYLNGDASVNPDNNYQTGFSSDLDTPNNVGQVTGEGKYGDRTNFKFNAKSTKKNTKATCVIRDRDAGIVVRCQDATGYARNGNTITVKGNATVNGQPTTYEMQLLNDTEFGDIFGLQLGTGYTRSGVVTDGAITIIR